LLSAGLMSGHAAQRYSGDETHTVPMHDGVSSMYLVSDLI
jgi:hypothetical protein